MTMIKHDLQKILAWFIIDCFAHNIDLKAQAKKKQFQTSKYQ